MCKVSGGIAMSIDLQFAPTPRVADSNAPSTTPSTRDVEQGSEWLTILECLFQTEPERSNPDEMAAPKEPTAEIASPVPPLAIAFLAAFRIKESPANSSPIDSIAEPKEENNPGSAEFIVGQDSRQPEAFLNQAGAEGGFELSPEHWELVPMSVPTPPPSLDTPPQPFRIERPSKDDAPNEHRIEITARGPMRSVAEATNDRQIASAVFSITSPRMDDESSSVQPEVVALGGIADEDASLPRMRVGNAFEGSESEAEEQAQEREGKPSKEVETLLEASSTRAGDDSDASGTPAGFFPVGNRHSQESGTRSIENRSSPVSFATEVDGAMADPGEATRSSPVNLDLRISHGDLGLPNDSGAGGVRLQLRQRGDEIQMRLHGTGEGLASLAQSEWAGLTERLRPQGIEAEKVHFAAIHTSPEPEARPLQSTESMQGEGSGNTNADGQRRQHERDQRQEQQRIHQERTRRQGEMEGRFSNFLNW